MREYIAVMANKWHFIVDATDEQFVYSQVLILLCMSYMD